MYCHHLLCSFFHSIIYEKESSPPGVQNHPGEMLGHEVKSHLMVSSSRTCRPQMPFGGEY